MSIVDCEKHGTSHIVCVSPDVRAAMMSGLPVRELRRIEHCDIDEDEDEDEDDITWVYVSYVSPEFAAEHSIGDEKFVLYGINEIPRWVDAVGRTPVCVNCLRDAFEGELKNPTWITLRGLDQPPSS